MTTAILDTNIFVRAALHYADSASTRALDAYFDGRYQLIFSPTTQEELLHVLNVPHIRARLDWSDDELLEFLSSILVNALIYPGEGAVSARITRDATDAKFLALAAESHADFLVTKDGRHLLGVKRFKHTTIVTPAVFMRELARHA
jgi:putative PIN family toxin of toxin-antitoxin system